MKTIYNTNKKQLLIMSLLLLFSMGAMAQNTNSNYGYYSLYFNTSGFNNSAFGYQSLYSNTSGSDNTANGTGALYLNTTGSGNTANGIAALYSNITGNYNTANGFSALYDNTTGNNNTALGYGADVSSGALTNATVIGYNAIATASNTVTIGNTSVTDNYFSGNVRGGAFIKSGGTSSQFLMADGSVSTGGGGSSWGGITGTLSSQTDLQNALNLKANVASPTFTGIPTAPTAAAGTNTTQIATTAFVLANNGNMNIEHLEFNNAHKTIWNNGNGNRPTNTSYGEGALALNITGANNTANGFYALYLNTTGGSNIATGFRALFSNTIGSINTANGFDALFSNTAGYANTANGFKALYSNTSGSNNTANGINTLSSNTTGNFNTANGVAALQSNTVGSNNTALGYAADVNAGNLTNVTVIGYNAKATASNTVTIGNASVTDNYFTGNVRGGAFVKSGGTSSQYLMADGSVSTGGGGSSWGGITGTLSSQTDLQNALNLKADVASPTFTGIPTAPTAAAGTNTTQIATTAFVLANASGGNIGHLEFNNTDKTVWNNGNGNISANTSYGEGALRSNTTGGQNTANGYYVLSSNTTGGGNTANGYYALSSNTTGSGNTANGNSALRNTTTGSANTANGSAALHHNTSGFNNTANGYGALHLNTTGNWNTANGVEALYFNTTGYANTANGNAALYWNTTGSNNTALGYAADVSVGNLTNVTAIGYNAIVTASNTIRLGDTSVTQIGGQVGWSTLSDGRFKENIKENVPGLNFITKLRPVTYTLNTKKIEAISMKNIPDSLKTKRMQKSDAYRITGAKIKTGFVAQEVEKAAKALGYDFDGVNTPQNDTDHYSLTYSEFVVPLVKGMQEQQQQIDLLHQQVDDLKKLVSQLTGVSSRTSTTEDDGISIYPNPNKGLFSVSTTGTLIDKIEVSNLTGSKLQTIDSVNNTRCSLNLSGYPSGVYLLKISSKNKIIATKKVIIE